MEALEAIGQFPTVDPLLLMISLRLMVGLKPWKQSGNRVWKRCLCCLEGRGYLLAKKNEQSEEHKTVKDHCQTECFFFPEAVDGCKCTEHWSGKSGKPPVA